MGLLMNDVILKQKMVIVAEIYIQKPNDPFFKRFSPEALWGVKRLAKSLKKVREEGKIN